MSSINAIPDPQLGLLVTSGDNTATLNFQTNSITALQLDNSQNANCTSTGAVIVPSGPTSTRVNTNGAIRFNTDTYSLETYVGGSWQVIYQGPAPQNTVAPVVSGSTAVGGTLSVTTGTWTNSPTSYAYQWYANNSSITSATANTFTLTSTQLGANISCNVTATNNVGSVTAQSNSVGPVSLNYTISYLVIAGGGGGGTGVFAAGFGGGGGGGAGGYLESTASVSPGAVYTATVGGGGSGGAPGSTGSNSTLIGTGVSVTSNGGGYGGRAQQGTVTGGNGGSGGGGGVGGGGGAGTSGQGNNGSGASGPSGGGGGGASSAASALAGGNGSSSSITGSAVTRAGGGGGGGYDGNFGTGGSGGGGRGGQSTGTTSGTSGTANTGGGGGGGTQIQNSEPNQFGGAGSGGSGIVILSIPTSSYSGTQSGASVTTSGNNTILTFTSSGTYTA